MTPETMRALGYRVVDHLVSRWEGLPDDVAWRGAGREELEARFRRPPPERGEDPEAVILEAVEEILPLAGRIDHPRFFAFVPSSPTWPSVLADFLAAGFNVFQGTWLESAGPSQIELIVLDWFRAWLDMPAGAGGLLTSGGSAANLVAAVAALERAGRPVAPTAYLPDQGHSSLVRAARTAGVPQDGIRRLPTGPDRRLDPDQAARAMDRDRGDGHTPVVLFGNGGSTNTGVADPLRALARVCRDRDVWFHVDAAMGGFAVLTPEGRAVLDGIGEADSVTLDPHKWLFQPYECGCLLARDPRHLEAAFRYSAEYLQDTNLGTERVNFGDRGIQLTRSFRALKLWISIRTFGTGAFRAAVARGMELARRAEERVRRSRELELLSPAGLGVVCYRFRPRETPDDGSGRELEAILEAWNRTIQDRIVESGYAMISSTRLDGRYSLRLCILGHRSRWDDVEGVLERVEEEGRRLAGAGGPGRKVR